MEIQCRGALDDDRRCTSAWHELHGVRERTPRARVGWSPGHLGPGAVARGLVPGLDDPCVLALGRGCPNNVMKGLADRLPRRIGRSELVRASNRVASPESDFTRKTGAAPVRATIHGGVVITESYDTGPPIAATSDAMPVPT